MYADLNSTAPASPQGTLWAEVWRFEGVDASAAPACDTPAALAGHCPGRPGRLSTLSIFRC